MKLITYIVEEREAKTDDFISNTGFAKLKDARKYFNEFKNNKSNWEGQTLSIIKQISLYEDGECYDMDEEEITKEILGTNETFDDLDELYNLKSLIKIN
jgi:hypothetical protein